jgi:hypothetical protein
MKYTLILITIVFLSSCGPDTYINHKLQAEKMGADCNNEITPVKITSNINGEHYEFEHCLAEGFDATNYTVERKGDSIVVTFPEPANKPTVLYKLTLDIDAYPAYSNISLGGRTIAMKPAERL